MSSWERVYDAEFAHVYDDDFVERLDLSWDGARLSLSIPDDTPCRLDIRGITELRKLLQAIERLA